MKELLKNLEELCKRIQKEIRDSEFYKDDYTNVIAGLKKQKEQILSEVSDIKAQKVRAEEDSRAEKLRLFEELSKREVELNAMKSNVETERVKLMAATEAADRAKETAIIAKGNYEEKASDLDRQRQTLVDSYGRKMEELIKQQAVLTEKLKKHEEMISALR